MGELIQCLNCGGELRGPFCAHCGQRAVPPDPTVRELAGDAWQELTGYDGRIMSTLRGVVRPGFLTHEYISGRRKNYLPPVRIYLIVSVIYFVIAASAPDTDQDRRLADARSGDGVRVSITPGERLKISDEDRKQLLDSAKEAPWYLKPILLSVAEDPDAFQTRMFTIMPRVFFALVPVFAGLVAVFYRRRHFPTALVFALHLHVFAFVAFAVAEAIKFTHSEVLSAVVGVIMLVLLVLYALRSFRAVFGGSWPVTLVKAASIAILYAIASVPAFMLMLVWASWV